MLKFILASTLYLATLFAVLDMVPGDPPQLLGDLALDQAEFTQSLPELAALQKIDPCPGHRP